MYFCVRAEPEALYEMTNEATGSRSRPSPHVAGIPWKRANSSGGGW